MLHILRIDVASVLSICYECFSGFSSVYRCFCKCFKCMFQVFSFVFFCILQVLHLDVSKVDRDVGHVVMVFQVYVPNVSDILDVCCKSRSGVVHVVVGPISRSHLLAATGPQASVREPRGHEWQAWKLERA